MLKIQKKYFQKYEKIVKITPPQKIKFNICNIIRECELNIFILI